MNRIREAVSLVPKRNLVGLLLFSVVVIWLLTYSAVVNFIRSEGGVVEELGRKNILLSTLDGTLLTFSLLVYLVAAIVPVGILLIRPVKNVSYAAQFIWAAEIVGLAYASKALA